MAIGPISTFINNPRAAQAVANRTGGTVVARGGHRKCGHGLGPGGTYGCIGGGTTTYRPGQPATRTGTTVTTGGAAGGGRSQGGQPSTTGPGASQRGPAGRINTGGAGRGSISTGVTPGQYGGTIGAGRTNFGSTGTGSIGGVTPGQYGGTIGAGRTNFQLIQAGYWQALQNTPLSPRQLQYMSSYIEPGMRRVGYGTPRWPGTISIPGTGQRIPAQGAPITSFRPGTTVHWGTNSYRIPWSENAGVILSGATQWGVLGIPPAGGFRRPSQPQQPQRVTPTRPTVPGWGTGGMGMPNYIHGSQGGSTTPPPDGGPGDPGDGTGGEVVMRIGTRRTGTYYSPETGEVEYHLYSMRPIDEGLARPGSHVNTSQYTSQEMDQSNY